MNIKDVIHYYIGQQAYTFPADSDSISRMNEIRAKTPEIRYSTPITIHTVGKVLECGYVPILRPLGDITEEEIEEGGWHGKSGFAYYMTGNGGAFHPHDFHYLLSRGFDLFELIDSCQAVDAKTL